MKRLRSAMSGVGTGTVFLFLFLAGILIGALFANVFQTYYMDEFSSFNVGFTSSLSTIKIDTMALFWMAIAKQLKGYLLMWLICVTILGIPYLFWIDLYKGFCAGFLMSTYFMQYGFKGIGLFFAYTIPQYLIYVPVFVITLLRGYEMNKRLYSKADFSVGPKKNVILSYVPLVLMLLCFLVFGCLLEAFVGANITIRYADFLVK